MTRENSNTTQNHRAVRPTPQAGAQFNARRLTWPSNQTGTSATNPEGWGTTWLASRVSGAAFGDGTGQVPNRTSGWTAGWSAHREPGPKTLDSANDNSAQRAADWRGEPAGACDIIEVSTLDALAIKAWSTNQPIWFAGATLEWERQNLARSLAGEFRTTVPPLWFREIRNAPDGVTPASENTFDTRLKTDGAFWQTPPRFKLLYFEQVAPGGEPIRLLPISNILAWLSPDHVDALRRGKVRFVRREGGSAINDWQGPLLARENEGAWTLRWRWDSLLRPEAADGIDQTRAAIAALKDVIDRLPAMEFVAEAPMLLVCPNQTWLQGGGPTPCEGWRCVWKAWI